MRRKEFIQKINDSKEYEGVGLTDCDEIVVRCLRTHKIVMVPMEAIEDSTWEDIEKVLSGEKEPGFLGFKSGAGGYYGEANEWPLDYNGQS